MPEEMHPSSIVLLVLAALGLSAVGYAAGKGEGHNSAVAALKAEAINANCAEYLMNPKTGESVFRWRKPAEHVLVIPETAGPEVPAQPHTLQGQ